MATDRPMQLGMVGLGRMGANIVQRLVRDGHNCVVYDVNADAVRAIEADGIVAATSLGDLAARLDGPRAVWLMLPAAITQRALDELASHLGSGDVIIDGGNSYYQNDITRAGQLAPRGLHYVDCGTSGGVWGLDRGYSLMIGGDKAVVDRLRPIFETLAPTPDKGWGHVGAVGSGHYSKMIHNGIEYGLMQAYAEGFSILQHKREFELDLHQVAEIWRYGSVVRSWLLDLTANALEKNPTLQGIAPYVADSGEGRWTVAEAIELGVPAVAITASLLERLRSRDTDSFVDKLLAAMRNQFGGHEIKKE